ncbi:MAG: hypothetical protein ABSA63_06135 [Thermoplasmata archaeon]
MVTGVSISLLFVLSAFAIQFGIPTTSPTSIPSNPGNGLTFEQAFASVNATLASSAGGPWQPTSILGIATQLPAAPLPNYKDSLNQTMRLCGALPGVTVWNSSGIPVFTGTLNSGAAPFWSFIFKNASGSYTFATNLQGQVQIDVPSVTLTNCVQAAGIGSSYFVNPSVDTPTVSQVAYSAAGRNFSVEFSPLAEYYVLGNDQILEPDASPFGWVVNYFRCDTVGVAGIQNYTAVGVLTSAGKSTTFVDNGWLSCNLSNYQVDFGLVSRNATTSFGSTTDVRLPFQVTSKGVLSDNRTLYDGWGFLSWMSKVQVLGGNGTALPVSTTTCLSWVPSLADCPSSGLGWFAVLLSQNGAWLDSYPSISDSPAWTIPNVIVSSQDQMVIVVPGSWNTSADTVDIGGTEPSPAVSGSVGL